MNKNNKAIAINSVINYLKLIITSILSLILSRVVLDRLGADNYGLYSVVGGIVVLLNVVSTAMITTTYRYVAFELGKGPLGKVNKVFNISWHINILLALLLLIIGLPLGYFYIENYLNVATSDLYNAHFVYIVSIVTAAICTTGVPFSGLLTAKEKFLSLSIISIFDILLKLLLVLLFLKGEGQVTLYAILMAICTIGDLLIKYLYCRIKFSHIICFRLYKDWHLFKEMLSFTWWILFGAVSAMGKSQGAALIVNAFFGTLLNAAYGIANQVNACVLSFTSSIGQAAIPQITKSFSSGNHERSLQIVAIISKYSMFLMLIVVLPLICHSDFILSLWLKKVPEYSAIFVVLMCVDGVVNCLGAGLPALIQATGNIRIFQVVSSLVSLSSLLFAYYSFSFGAPPYNILIIYILISLIYRFIQLYLMKRVLDFDVMWLVRVSYFSSFKVILVIIPVISISYWCSSALSIILHAICTEIFLISAILYFGMDSNERRGLLNMFSKLRRGQS